MTGSPRWLVDGMNVVGSRPDAADREIAARVERDRDPGLLRVVTSDRALAERVEAAGAEVVPAGGFRRRIEGYPD
ncbi:MAG: hypothetical protein ACR2LY_06975 [Thermoleophilaceae bacterium]